MRKHGLLGIRAGLIAAGIILVILGLTRGETVIMLQKAVNVCLECIGIG
jgi:hypothetical protein